MLQRIAAKPGRSGSRQPVAHGAFEYAGKKGEKICAKLRGEMLWFAASHDDHAGQSTNPQIQLEAGLGLHAFDFGAID